MVEVDEVVVVVLSEVVATVVRVLEAAVAAMPKVESIAGASVLAREIRCSPADFAAACNAGESVPLVIATTDCT